MADTKLSALPSATSLSGAKIYGTQGGSSKAFSAELFGAVLVGTRTALKALDTALAQAAFLTEAGREGLFLWMAGNYSTLITADTAEGIYVKATAIASSAGSWVRVYAHAARAEWFGAVGDGSTNDATAINAALALVGHVALGRKTYAISATINLSTDSRMLVGEGRTGGVFNGSAQVGSVLKWTGSSGGTMVIAGSATSSVDMHGGGLCNVQLDANATANICLMVRTIDSAEFRNLKMLNLRDNSGSVALYLTANADGFAPVNCVYRCSFENINIQVAGAANGFYNASPATSGGQNITFCTFTNIHVTHDDGLGFYISAMDDCTFNNIATSRVTGGTGANVYLDGNAVSGKGVFGCVFNAVQVGVADGTPSITAIGAYCRQNFMRISGVDDNPTISISTGAELFYEFLGTGYSGAIATEAPFNRVPPLKIRKYAVTDNETLDWYEESSSPTAPAVRFGGASVGVTYTRQVIEWTRIGDTVHFSIDIILSAKGSSTGNLDITGLPYAKKSGMDATCAVRATGMTSGVGDTFVHAKIAQGATTVTIFKIATGSETQLANGDLTNTTTLTLSGSYKV